MGKALSLEQFKKNNLLITVVIVLVVIGLLFVPDFLGFDNANTINKSAHVDFDLKTIWGGITDKSEDSNIAKITTPEVTEVQELPLEEVTDKSDSTQQISIKKQSEITWNTISASNNRKLMTAIKIKASALANELPLELRNSKFALYDFIAGLDFIMGSAAKTLSPYEAVQYMERLDLAVTQTLKEEGADRVYLVNWSKISLNTIFGDNYADQVKLSSVPKFSPRIIFKEIKASRFPKATNSSGKVTQYEYQAAIIGYFQGKDVTAVRVLHDGDLVSDLRYTSIKGGRGNWYEFETQQLKSGIISLVFESQDGQKIVVHYNLSARGGRFPWKRIIKNDNQGVIKISSIEMGRALEARYRFNSQTDNVDFGNLLSLTGSTYSPSLGNLTSRASGNNPYVQF
jgi:hypothetical protein